MPPSNSDSGADRRPGAPWTRLHRAATPGQAWAELRRAFGRGEMTKTILIVEDNDLNMKLFQDLLEAHGYKTLPTKDGLEAMKLARQHRPDLILMDIQLPEISGL